MSAGVTSTHALAIFFSIGNRKIKETHNKADVFAFCTTGFNSQQKWGSV
jgi:hypothetical protein